MNLMVIRTKDHNNANTEETMTRAFEPAPHGQISNHLHLFSPTATGRRARPQTTTEPMCLDTESTDFKYFICFQPRLGTTILEKTAADLAESLATWKNLYKITIDMVLSWVILQPFCRNLGPSWGHLRPFWALLGPSWGPSS